MITFKYKTGYIHDNFTTNVIRVQHDLLKYTVQVKSIHAAKLLITKLMKEHSK